MRTPKVQRAGETLVQAVDRATDLVRRTLDYAREGPPPLRPRPGRAGAAGRTRRPRRHGRSAACSALDNAVDVTLLVKADRIQLFRVLVNLLRNSAEAGARTVTDHRAACQPHRCRSRSPMMGLACRSGCAPICSVRSPAACAAAEPGSDWRSRAISWWRMAATIELVETSEAGTTFRLTLRIAEPPTPAVHPQAPERIAPAAPADV